MKLRAFPILSTLLCVFMLSSCNTANNDPYKDKIAEKSSEKIHRVGCIKTEYISGSAIDINGMKVYFLDSTTEVPYFDSDETTIEKDKYFITTSESAPTVNRIKKSDKIQTGRNKYSLNVYIGIINDEDKVYLSKPITITITNSKAINPVLYYVGTAVIFIAIGVLIYVTQKHKRT